MTEAVANVLAIITVIIGAGCLVAMVCLLFSKPRRKR